jgi:hypothetical protein
MQTNENGFQMAVVPQSFLQEVIEKLDAVESILQKKTEEEINSEWIDSVKARKLLGVSPKTWQEYRNKRVIPFSQFGSKIYVKRSDIKSFMEKNYIRSK